MTFKLEKYERVLEENRRRVEAALSFEEPDRVPVQINVQGAYYAWLFGVPLRDYYTDLKLMAEVQLKGLEWRLSWLRDDVTSVAITLDLGAVAEGIVFSCRIVMPDDSDPWRSPWIVPKIKSLDDIDRLEVPDPRDLPAVRDVYRRLEELRRLVRDRYGDIPVWGGLQIHPPVSAAGSLMGPERLYSWLYRYPDEMHKLFRKLEEAFVALHEYHCEVTGSEPGSLYLADDHSGYLNRRMYEEFALPYNLRLFERFGTRYRYLHMDSPMHHIADIVRDVYRVNHADLGVESDIRLIAREFKGRVSFNGNANWRALLSGSRTLIEVEVERCIYYAAPGGGYIFDNGGETYAGVPPELLKYEVEYAKRVGKYPIKRENFRHLDELEATARGA
ncbi:MAG: uroporphyrinogen decarboxylase family protein [Thermofilaceae archaeon]